MNEAPPDPAACALPIACTLAGTDRRQRGEEIERLMREGAPEARQLPDGVALRFPGEEIWASRLLAFIMGERACSPFLTFELVFEPGQGPIWLRIRGPEGAVDFLADLLAPIH